MLLLGAAMLLGALAGSRDPLQPLSVLRSSAAGEARSLPFTRVRSLAELEAGSPRRAAGDARFLCRLVRLVQGDGALHLRRPAVQAKLAGWTLLQADVTANSAADKALLQRFKLYGPPGIIFFDRQGQGDRGVRVVGFQDADEFLGLLSRLDLGTALLQRARRQRLSGGSGRVPTGKRNSAAGARLCSRTDPGGLALPRSGEFCGKAKAAHRHRAAWPGRCSGCHHGDPRACGMKAPRPTSRLLIAQTSLAGGRRSLQTRRKRPSSGRRQRVVRQIERVVRPALSLGAIGDELRDCRSSHSGR
jgi:hypothetical protein